MKHVRKYAKDHGVTIKQAMSLACDSYYTKCRGRKQKYSVPSEAEMAYGGGSGESYNFADFVPGAYSYRNPAPSAPRYEPVEARNWYEYAGF